MATRAKQPEFTLHTPGPVSGPKAPSHVVVTIAATGEYPAVHPGRCANPHCRGHQLIGIGQWVRTDVWGDDFHAACVLSSPAGYRPHLAELRLTEAAPGRVA